MVAWWFRHGESTPARDDTAQPPVAVAPAAPAAPPPRPTRPPAPGRPDAAAAPAGEPEIVIVPVGNDDPRPDAVMHPHPISPRHVRIQHENALIGQLNGAMDVEDGPGMRRLLDQYKDEFPEDENQLQEGYGIIADCLQHPSEAARAAGQNYFDRERGSILRLFVQRHCLERQPR